MNTRCKKFQNQPLDDQIDDIFIYLRTQIRECRSQEEIFSSSISLQKITNLLQRRAEDLDIFFDT